MRAFKCLLVCAHYAVVHAPPQASLNLGDSLPCGVCPATLGIPSSRVVVEITLAKNELRDGDPD